MTTIESGYICIRCGGTDIALFYKMPWPKFHPVAGPLPVYQLCESCKDDIAIRKQREQ